MSPQGRLITDFRERLDGFLKIMKGLLVIPQTVMDFSQIVVNVSDSL